MAAVKPDHISVSPSKPNMNLLPLVDKKQSQHLQSNGSVLNKRLKSEEVFADVSTEYIQMKNQCKAEIGSNLKNCQERKAKVLMEGGRRRSSDGEVGERPEAEETEETTERTAPLVEVTIETAGAATTRGLATPTEATAATATVVTDHSSRDPLPLTTTAPTRSPTSSRGWCTKR